TPAVADDGVDLALEARPALVVLDVEADIRLLAGLTRVEPVRGLVDEEPVAGYEAARERLRDRHDRVVVGRVLRVVPRDDDPDCVHARALARADREHNVAGCRTHGR